MVKFKFIISSLLMFCLCSFCIVAHNDAIANTKTTTFKVATDKSELVKDEDFHIFFEVTTSFVLDINDLDTTPLFNDFYVGNIDFKVINANNKLNTYKWIIPIIPLKQGIIKVPKLDFKNHPSLKTPNFELKINPNNSAVNDNSKLKKLIKTHLRSKKIIKGQFALYRVEIELNPDIRIETITPPSAKGAKVELFAERTISSARAGKKFHKTLIREYKIIFNEAGKIIVKSPAIHGIISQKNKSFIQKSDDIQLVVEKAQKPGYVTESLSITSKWTPNENEISVGTPITRTITIRGTNISLSQLPHVPLPKLENFDSYQDDIKESEKILKNHQFIATRTINQVFVPKKNHTTFEVNDIPVNWVNPNNNQQSTSYITGKRIEINGFSFNDFIPRDPKQTTYIIISIISIIALIVFGIYSYIWYRQRWGIYAYIHNFVDNTIYWKNFKKGWNNNDPFQSRRALLEWGQKRWPNLTIVGVNNLPFYHNIEEEAKKLSEACWSPNHSQWNGKNLYKLVSKNKNYKKPKAKKGINPYGLNGEIYETVQQKMK